MACLLPSLEAAGAAGAVPAWLSLCSACGMPVVLPHLLCSRQQHLGHAAAALQGQLDRRRPLCAPGLLWLPLQNGSPHSNHTVIIAAQHGLCQLIRHLSSSRHQRCSLPAARCGQKALCQRGGRLKQCEHQNAGQPFCTASRRQRQRCLGLCTVFAAGCNNLCPAAACHHPAASCSSFGDTTNGRHNAAADWARRA